MVLRFLGFFFFAFAVFACKPPTKTCDDCAEKEKNTGKYFYSNQCISCHGSDGKLANSGATDLSLSKISDKQIKEILSEGQGAMPPALELVGNPELMDSVVQYIKTLRKK
jgi:mono/diheme cytochrome c family protein